MRIRESLVRNAGQLSECHIPDPYLEAEVLMRHALGLERAELFATYEEVLAPHQEHEACQLLRRRLEGEALAYILGHREFYGLDLYVNPHVLIPRQETELLVDKALEVARGRPGQDLRVADVGTGSGAIAIAIARHLDQVTVYATDVSPQCLHVADVNRRRHGVSEIVQLREGDLLEALDGPVDIIVCNPPYIRSDEMAGLAPEIKWEPALALDGGDEGLDVTRRLLCQAPAFLRPAGSILVEIDPVNIERVSRIAGDTFPEARVSSARDLLGFHRVVIVELARRRDECERSTLAE